MDFWCRLFTSIAEKRPETVEEWKSRKKEELKYLWIFGIFFLFIFTASAFMIYGILCFFQSVIGWG